VRDAGFEIRPVANVDRDVRVPEPISQRCRDMVQGKRRGSRERKDSAALLDASNLLCPALCGSQCGAQPGENAPAFCQERALPKDRRQDHDRDAAIDRRAEREAVREALGSNQDDRNE